MDFVLFVKRNFTPLTEREKWRVSVTLVIGNRNVASWYHINFVTDQISMEWGRNTVLIVISNSTKKIHLIFWHWIIHDYNWLCLENSKKNIQFLFLNLAKNLFQKQLTNTRHKLYHQCALCDRDIVLLVVVTILFVTLVKLNVVYTIWPLFYM